MKSLYCVCLLLLLSLIGHAQIENYKIYNISSDEGLPTDNITYIYRDSYGFIWMASYEGLIRYDGYEYQKYSSSENDSNSISNNIVYRIFEDSKKRLWVGTIQGLDLYDRSMDRFIHCKLSNDKPRIPINAIVEDSKNQLWIGTSFGLCNYNPENKEYKWYINDVNDKSSLSNDVIFTLAKDKEDNLWIGTFAGGVNKFYTNTGKFVRFLHESHNDKTIISNKIRSLLVDHNNNVWVGTEDKGISLINNAEGKVYKHFPMTVKGGSTNDRNMINCIYEDKRNTIWVGAERELLQYFDNKSQTFNSLTQTSFKKSNLYCESISSIIEDQFGSLWFASSQRGIYYTNSSKNVFKHFFKEKPVSRELGHNTVISFFESKNGIVWIGTDGGGLTSFDVKNNAFKNHNAIGRKSVYDIKEDKQGNLWLATWNSGIIKYDPKTNRTIEYTNDPTKSNSLIYNNIKSILIEDSLVWIGTHGEGLCVFNTDKNTFTHHSNNKRFPFDMKAPSWINHLFRDSKNRIWISTYGGLYLYDRKGMRHFSHSKEENTISANSVNMVTEDGNGRIWAISESGGLDLFDEANNSFVRYSSKVNLPKSLKGITIDKNENIWLSSNEGLTSLNTKTNQVNRFDISDGIQGNSFFHKSTLLAKSGNLYFGGPYGFNVFNPDSIQRGTSVAPLYFTSLSIYDEVQGPLAKNSPLKKVLTYTDTVTLTHKQAFFSIGFTLINYFSSSKTKFAYKVDGLHNKWVSLGSSRKISFTNLPAGEYILHVRYTDVNGKWMESPKTLFIEILPPWYNTLWFRILLFFFTLGAIMLIFYLRLASIKKQNRILEEEVKKRTLELSEVNTYLLERNEEIQLQNERLEEFNHKILNQSDKILNQQKHIIEQNQLLEATVEELKRSNQTKDKFFSILAHDLKNPVAALTGISESLNFSFSKLTSKEIHGYIKDLHKTSQGVYNLLINLLNWSKTQSKNIEHFPSYFNLNELILKNLSLTEHQVQNKKLKINNNVNPKHFAYADYNMLDTVIRNLLNNSIKFTYLEGEICIDSEETPEQLTITIADNGMGMSEEQLESLFEIEKHQNSVGTLGEAGTGLGLVITKEFIQANGGTIQVTSKKGEGSSFKIILPKTEILENIETHGKEWESPIEQLKDNVEELGFDKLLKLKGKRLLIVDDNRELREHLKLMLSDTFELFEAENGKEALKLAIEHQPFAIISDLIMPELNGVEFCKQLKSNTSTSHIPVILLTSQSDEENQIEGYGAGAEVYLTKPIKKRLLLTILLNFHQNLELLREKMSGSDKFIPDDVQLNKADEEFLNKAIEITLENLSDQHFDYKIICDEMNISRTVLYNKIKTYTGQGVHEFIKEIRLKKSLKLLNEGKLSISQIAFEVGFNSHSYFNKCFTKKFKMAPKDFMKKKKKKDDSVSLH